MSLSISKDVSVALLILYRLPWAFYRIFVSGLSSLIPPRFRRRKCIDGQTVLITGAGSGIGRQLAIEFSRHSCCLVLLDLKKSSLMDTEKLLYRCSRTLVFECDVSNRKRVYKMAEEVLDKVGKVDVLVNNAGIVTGKRFMELPDEMVVKTLEVNTLAHFWMIKAFLPQMLESNSGHIVSVASMAGLHGLPCLADYCASKYAAVGLMESLRTEFDAAGKEGVKTTIVCPNLTQTGLFEGTNPVLSIMTPEYVARNIVKAVLAEEELVMLPRWGYIIFMLRWIMPDVVVKAFYREVGILHFMDTFKGRRADLTNGHKGLSSIRENE